MEQEINMRGLLKTLLKRLWLILLAAILGCGITLLYTVNFVEPQYKARVTMYVNNNRNQETNVINSSDLSVAVRLVDTYINIIRSDRVLDKVIEETGIDIARETLSNRISAVSLNDTEMFAVTVYHKDPEAAAELANAIADIAPAEISAIIQGSKAEIVDRAKVPKTYSEPDYKESCTKGLLAGAAMTTLIICMIHVLDVRVRSEEDLKSICEFPVLGAIPDVLEIVKKTGKKRSWRK